MYFYLIFNFDFLSRVKKSILAVQNGQFRLHIPLLGGRKKSSTFWCFYWLISSALARWFQKCIHVYSKYYCKWVKIVKNLRELAISLNVFFQPGPNRDGCRHIYDNYDLIIVSVQCQNMVSVDLYCGSTVCDSKCVSNSVSTVSVLCVSVTVSVLCVYL